MKKRKKSNLIYCEKDFNHKHEWQRIGIDGKYIYLN